MTQPVFPDWLKTAKTIAIVGYGREGKSTNQFLEKNFPDKKILVYETHQDTFDVPQVDVVFKSPGIPAKKVHLHPDAYLTSQADLFTQMFGEQTIAVTGTKGKSTTAHAINHVLNSIEHHSLLVGNIGKPALDFVEQMDEDTTAIFEMSAFQTESLHTAPHIAIFTSLYQDHLDYYDSMKEYTAAKKHLFDLQAEDDICMYRDDYPQLVKLLSDSVARKLPYRDEHGEVPVNYIPALLIASEMGASEKQIDEALETIQSLPGRLEKVAVQNGIAFYDDALATIPEATISALDTLGDAVKVLIAGGHDRNQHFEELAKRIADSKITTLILFPPVGERLAEELRKITKKIEIVDVTSMEEAITAAYSAASDQSIVLLSTAAPSFGLFKDYADRSRQYKEWIEKLASSP